MKKTGTRMWLLCAGILLLAGITVGIARWDSSRTGELVSFDTEVVVSDGVAVPEMESRSLSVATEGRYAFRCNLSTDREGLITGCKVYNGNGELLLVCSGEEFSMESEELDLAEGDYTVEFWYLGNRQRWKDFLERSGEALSSQDGDGKRGEEYVFAENGTWNLHLEYGVKKALPAYVPGMLGLVFGILCGILALVLIVWLIRKMGGQIDIGVRSKQDSYDERQMLIRGQAYKAAFFTLMGYMFVSSVLDEMFEIPLFMSFGGMWLGICLSIFVFAAICIWRDAYMSMYSNAKGMILSFLILGIVNLIGGSRLVWNEGLLLENGALSNACVNLVSSVLIFAVLLVFIARLLYNRQHVEGEEEE